MHRPSFPIFEVDPDRCPACREFVCEVTEVTAATTYKRPAAGDLWVCWFCGALGQFTSSGIEGLSEVPKDATPATRAQIERLQKGIRQMRGLK